MGHVMYLYDESTNTTLYLTNGTDDIYLEPGYAPQTPEVTLQEFDPGTLEDGGEIPETTRRNVTETFRVWIAETSRANLQTTLHLLERMISTHAPLHQRDRRSGPVYVSLTLDGGSTYRSEILGGRVQANEWGTDTGWLSNKLGVEITWTRRFYWFETSAALTLANNSGSGTAGITVYNHSDYTGGAGHDNWVEIAAATAGLGSLEVPINLSIENNFASANSVTTIWVGMYAFTDYLTTVANFQHILEGESDTLSSDQADAACSGGYKGRVTWATDENGIRFNWALTSAMLNAYDSRFYYVLARVTDIEATTKLQLRVFWGASQIWAGPQITANVAVPGTYTSRLIELGAVQLPPWLPGRSAFSECALKLYAQRTGGDTIDLDFLAFMPMDSFMKLQPAVSHISTDQYLSIDGRFKDILVHDGTIGNLIAGNYVATGTQLVMWPYRVHRLYFLHHDTNGEAPIDRTLLIAGEKEIRVLTV